MPAVPFKANAKCPPYPEAEASADELASLRGKPAPAWRSDGVVQRAGNCRLAGRAADEPGRPGMVFAACHSDGADAPGGVPPRAAPDRRSPAGARASPI